MLKKILIIALKEDWTGISRLPGGLERVGFRVFALCPKNSYLAKTKFLEGVILYPTYTYSRSVLIYLWMTYSLFYYGPDLVIPGDEDALLALQHVSSFFEKIPFFNKISKIIRKSLPSKMFDSILLHKSDFQKKCSEWEIRTPKNIVLGNVESALFEASKMGYPVVLKKDSGYGGSGVFICHNKIEVIKCFQLNQVYSFFKKFNLFIKEMFFISIHNNDQKISIQQYIDGQVGQAPFCAYNGVVFGFNPMLRIKTHPGKTGPASVSCGYEDKDIQHYIEKIAREMNYTGFGSLEYVLDKKSGLIYIIELNPRPTPTVHLGSTIVQNDLCQLFYFGINSFPTKLNMFKPYTVAMFPGEKRRDPNSHYLLESYHDVPFNDPLLLEALDAQPIIKNQEENSYEIGTEIQL